MYGRSQIYRISDLYYYGYLGDNFSSFSVNLFLITVKYKHRNDELTALHQITLLGND